MVHLWPPRQVFYFKQTAPLSSLKEEGFFFVFFCLLHSWVYPWGEVGAIRTTLKYTKPFIGHLCLTAVGYRIVWLTFLQSGLQEVKVDGTWDVTE